MTQSTALQDKLNGVDLPAAADMHVHLRDGDMTKLIVYVEPGKASVSIPTIDFPLVQRSAEEASILFSLWYCNVVSSGHFNDTNPCQSQISCHQLPLSNMPWSISSDFNRSSPRWNS
jgi:hypothetical protein